LSDVKLARSVHLEAIPRDPAHWDVKVRGAERLAATLGVSSALAAERLRPSRSVEPSRSRWT